jgi:hypothetical protein
MWTALATDEPDEPDEPGKPRLFVYTPADGMDMTATYWPDWRVGTRFIDSYGVWSPKLHDEGPGL